jgi:flagellar basal-body rod protein FlgG
MGLHISASGILTALLRNDVTANNVANARTPGFKSSRVNDVDTISGGVRTGGINKDMSAGSFQITDRATDVASTEGFFRVLRPDGTQAYTRDGAFGLNAEGELVTSHGSRLDPPVQVPTNATSVTVASDGTVFVTTPGNFEPQRVGQIQVFQFANPGGLESLGSNLLLPTAASGEPQAVTAQVESGLLEQSNVNLAEQFTDSMLNRAALRANVNGFRTQNETQGELLNIKR